MQTRGAGLLPCLRSGSVVRALVCRDPRKARSPALLTAACAREMPTPERADDRALVRVENWLGKSQLPVWGVAFVSPPGFFCALLSVAKIVPKYGFDCNICTYHWPGERNQRRTLKQHEM